MEASNRDVPYFSFSSSRLLNSLFVFMTVLRVIKLNKEQRILRQMAI